jgi:hypothetical protein
MSGSIDAFYRMRCFYSSLPNARYDPAPVPTNCSLGRIDAFPLGEHDGLRTSPNCSTCGFNPRPRVGATPEYTGYLVAMSSASIHAPAWGATTQSKSFYLLWIA